MTFRTLAAGSLILLLAFQGTSGAQVPAAPPRPNLQPGDRLEVYDGGVIKEVEFVEFTVVGLIKVRFEDDSQKAFRSNLVRLHKSTKLRPPGEKPAEKPSEPISVDPMPAALPEGVTGKRTWTDATGQFKIPADFVRLKDGLVELKREDGKVLSLPLEKLGPADQEIAKLMALAATTNAPKVAAPDVNPFEVDVSDGPLVKPSVTAANNPSSPNAAAADNAAPISLPDGPPLKADFDAKRSVVEKLYRGSARTITSFPATNWSARPDPSPYVAKSFHFGPGLFPSSRQELLRKFSIDPVHHWAWLTIHNQSGKPEVEKYRLERIDLQTGTALRPLSVPHKMEILSFNPSGREFVALQFEEVGHSSRILQVWEIAPTGLKLRKTIMPFDKQQGFDSSPTSDGYGTSEAHYVNENHLLVRSSEGNINLVDLRNLNVVYMLAGGTGFAMSPGRKYFAIAHWRDGVHVFDALSGQCMGQPAGIDLKMAPNYLIFSPDGAQIAGAQVYGSRYGSVSTGSFWTWKVSSGQINKSWHGVELPNANRRYIGFGGQNHLILNGTHAFSMDDGMFTCQFELSCNVGGGQGETVEYTHQCSAAGRDWYSVEKNTRREIYQKGVAGLALPGESVVQAFRKVDLNELLVIKPNARIRTSLELNTSVTQMAKMKTALATQFSANGWQLVGDNDECDFVLHGSIENGETKEHVYQTEGAGGQVHRANVTWLKGRLKLTKVGTDEVLWQEFAHWGPKQTVRLKLLQTIDDATQVVPDFRFFELPHIPARFVKYPKGLDAALVVGMEIDGGLGPPRGKRDY